MLAYSVTQRGLTDDPDGAAGKNRDSRDGSLLRCQLSPKRHRTARAVPLSADPSPVTEDSRSETSTASRVE
jgi:hypothetical protein